MYVKIFTEYPYLQWTFCFHNLISSFHHLLIWVPVAAVMNQKDRIDKPVLKILREIHDVPEEHIILSLKTTTKQNKKQKN